MGVHYGPNDWDAFDDALADYQAKQHQRYLDTQYLEKGLESPLCAVCERTAEEIYEYSMLAEDEGYATASEACRQEEGTYNYSSNSFWCTECYIKIGQPRGVAP